METKGEQARRIVNDVLEQLNSSDASMNFGENTKLAHDAVWLATEAPGNPNVYEHMTDFGLPVVIPRLLADYRFGPGLLGEGVSSLFNDGSIATARQVILEVLPKVEPDELIRWWGGAALAFVLAKNIASDPDFQSRVAALNALKTIPLPVTSVLPLQGAVAAFQEFLQGSGAPSAARASAAVSAKTVASRLASQRAQAETVIDLNQIPPTKIPTSQADLAALTRLDVPMLPGPGPDWKPWATLGVIVGAISGAVWWKRRGMAAPRPQP